MSIARLSIARQSFARLVVCPTGRLPDWSFARLVVCPTGRLPDWSFARLVVCPTGRLPDSRLPDRSLARQSFSGRVHSLNYSIMNTSAFQSARPLEVDFIALLDCQIMEAAALVADISRLPTEEASSLLAMKFIEVTEVLPNRRYFPAGTILAITLAAIFGPILLGWCILFVYFNTCAGMTWDGLFEKPGGEEPEPPVSSLADFPKLQNMMGPSHSDNANTKEEDTPLSVVALLFFCFLSLIHYRSTDVVFLKEMIVTFKTATNEAFKIEFDESVTVKDVKEKIQAEKGVNYPVEWQTLIYGGKILKDEETLAQVKLDEKKFIALMLLKPKLAKPDVVPKETQEQEAGKVDSTSADGAVHPEKTICENDDKGQEKPESTPPTHLPKPDAPAEAQAGQTPLESTNEEFERLVDEITSMGFQRHEVRKALRLAFNNPDRAVEYLTSGFPVGESGDSISNVESGVASQGDREEPVGGSDPLAPLRNYPGFARLRNAVQQNPDMLQDLITELEQANPSLIALINANQQAFVDLMNEEPEGEEAQSPEIPAEGNMEPPLGLGRAVIHLRPQDVEVIERLKSMGFPEAAVIEAYFACDKNETLAVNFLLQSMEDDDDTPLGPPQGP
uniref:UV excision repair protein RAD23 n=1 Tax=Trichuris muris TaxID=70415 RepID=A0A5S6QMK7_TRIMR